ncbi:MAG TPA: hypothetical protein VMU65_02945 [Candidatus Saccharimonadales bacterium]|nr:hypothetical protein [Candidatus Saccharimonadales bacterium]
MARRSLVSSLFRIARIADTVSAVTSGKPRRMARRAKNLAVGRVLRRAGFWRNLWR